MIAKLHPAEFKKTILDVVQRCIACDTNEKDWTLSDVQQIHRMLGGTVPVGRKEDLLIIAHERIVQYIVTEDNDHGFSTHLFAYPLVALMRRTISFSPDVDDVQLIIQIHFDIDGDVPIGSSASLRTKALRKLVYALQDETNALPNVSGYEKNLMISVDSDPFVRIADDCGTMQALLTIHAPEMDDRTQRERLCVCFVVSTSHAMEEGGRLDDILEGISEAVTLLDSDDYFSLVTFSRVASVSVPLCRVGLLRHNTETASDNSISEYSDNETFNSDLGNDDGADDEQRAGPDPSTVNLEKAFRSIRGGTTANVCEGLDAAIKEITKHAHDGLIPRTFRRVVIMIGNGCVNEGIRDVSMISAMVRRYRQNDKDNTAGKPKPVSFTISTIGVGVQTAEEEKVLESIALHGGGEYCWCATNENEEVQNVIVNETISWKLRTTHELSASFMGVEEMSSLFTLPPQTFNTECTSVAGHHSRIIRMDPAELAESINVADLNDRLMVEGVSDENNPSPVVQKPRLIQPTKKDPIKMRNVTPSDLVSGEERQMLFNVKLWMNSTSYQSKGTSPTQLDLPKQPIGCILVRFRYFREDHTDTVVIPLVASTIEEQKSTPSPSDLLNFGSHRPAQVPVNLSFRPDTAFKDELEQLVEKSEKNGSIERLRAFSEYTEVNQEMKEAALVAEKGDIQNARDRLTQLQKRVNAFTAPRLLSKERIMRRVVEIVKEMGQPLQQQLTENEDEFLHPLPNLSFIAPHFTTQDHYDIQQFRSYNQLMSCDSRIHHLLSIILQFLARPPPSQTPSITIEHFTIAARQISYYNSCLALGSGSHMALSMTEQSSSLHNLIPLSFITSARKAKESPAQTSNIAQVDSESATQSDYSESSDRHHNMERGSASGGKVGQSGPRADSEQQLSRSGHSKDPNDVKPSFFSRFGRKKRGEGYRSLSGSSDNDSLTGGSNQISDSDGRERIITNQPRLSGMGNDSNSDRGGGFTGEQASSKKTQRKEKGPKSSTKTKQPVSQIKPIRSSRGP
ncbi:hypothetical protein BLNAU_440 [Blattamonas nauphoetae]|uniref:VWFA domain-containing protein n=1 Tax=Blattamonas nauphoetae TaxID=2049346 RepID=A0ABQ9YL98_9EUKA|nr:hypothetical protein BLNAU_440 [Blattamonas nauphoetae]